MRVLHVIPSVSKVHGGPSQALELMEQGLSQAGMSVTTATTDDDGPSRRLDANHRPTEQHGARRHYFRKRLDFYKVAPSMLPWLWRNVGSFDVVHIHALFSFSSVAAAVVASMRRVPFVVRPLGTLARYGVTTRRPSLKRLSLGLLEAPILRRAAAVHFTSEAEWEEARALNLSLRGVVVPLAAQAGGQGNAQILLRDHPLLRGRQIVLFLSRLDPKKNVENLLKAFAAVAAQRNDLALVIAGNGLPDYVRSLKTLARELGIEPHMVWLGHVEGAQKDAAFAAADLFVLPSLSENFGIAAVEAMQHGLPCVLGQGVSIAMQVQDVGAGIAVSPDPEAISRALQELLSDGGRRKEMGEKARTFALQEYSTKAMTDRLIELYERIVATHDKEAL